MKYRNKYFEKLGTINHSVLTYYVNIERIKLMIGTNYLKSNVPNMVVGMKLVLGH